MTAPLLTTKLYMPPVRLESVSRPRLIQRLDDGLRQGCRLTLVSAPAGSGKTTLLSAWASLLGSRNSGFGLATANTPALRDQKSETRHHVAWLSLDDADNDPARFWTYLIAALQTAHPQLGQSALKILQSTQFSAALPASILTSLLNEIATLTGRVVLVLDDYHVISTQAIHAGIAFLLQHQPQTLHLALATRADPPLPVVRLRARGQLTELRAADLRFTVDEAALFLNETMGLGLAAEDIQALESRTEGWIVGLQLAALSMQGRSDTRQFVRAFTGSHHFVLEYLAQEVLSRQPEAVRQFLMRTSILDRLCEPLCDAVTGNRGSDAMLAYLQQGNLFIVPLDDERYWYRYHHLFADLLGHRLRKEISASEIAGLHRRASAWHEANGSVAEAVKHALFADEPERAANLIEQNLSRMTTGGELSTLLDRINELPEALIHSRPVLCIPRAWALVFAGQFDGVEPLLQAAERNLPPAGSEQPPQALAPDAGSVLRGNIATIRAFIADRTGDGSHAMELAQLADELLPPGDLMSRSLVPYILGRAYRTTGDLTRAARAASEMVRIGQAAGNEMTTVMGMCEQATLYKLRGQLRRAADLYRQAQQLKLEQGELNFVTWALVDVGLSDLLLEQNELAAARQRLERVVHNLEQMSWGGAPTDLVLAYTTLVGVLTAQGDLAGASAALQKAESARQRYNDFPGFKSVIASCQVGLWLARGELDQAVRWSQRFTGGDDTAGALLTDELEQIALARVRIAEGKTKEAHSLLARLAEATAAGGRRGRHIQVLVLQALALDAQNDSIGALAALEKALSLAEPEGYVRVFVDGGQPMADLLRAALSQGLLPDYVSQLLAGFGMQDQGPKPAISPPPQPAALVEPLSERELEVLHLISAGHTNQEIAARLVVTLNTVKKHTSNIYGKLEVNSRTQAIARARELGLIP